MVGAPIAIDINPVNPLPHRPYWAFDASASEAVWTTFEVPRDIASATVEIFIWSARRNNGTANSIRWGFDAQIANRAAVGVGALIGNQTGEVTVTYPEITDTYTHPTYDSFTFTFGVNWRYTQRDSLGTITVSAGDIVHVKIYRDPTHGDDTYPYDGALFAVDFEYTADS